MILLPLQARWMFQEALKNIPLSGSLWKEVHTPTQTYGCNHTQAHVHIRMHSTDTYAHTHTSTHAYTHAHKRTHTHMHMHSYTHLSLSQYVMFEVDQMKDLPSTAAKQLPEGVAELFKNAAINGIRVSDVMQPFMHTAPQKSS